MRNFSERTIELLKLCSMTFDADRRKELDRLCDKYSAKAVFSKLYDLSDKDYIEYGCTVRLAWLTKKGKEALASGL